MITRPRKIHLDTDLAGDPDDLCALAMLLGWPDVEIVAITTSDDPGGRRAGYVTYCLALADRGEIPVAGGAAASLTTMRSCGEIPDDRRYWPQRVQPRPSPPGAAVDLLDQSIQQGAAIVAIGPFTNLALLEVARPGRLRQVPIVAMGGYAAPTDKGLPPWGPEQDWNVQCDTRAAEILIGSASDLTLVTLAQTLKTHLRQAHLPRLRGSGRLGVLIANQAEAHGRDQGNDRLGRAHARLPSDLLNFHHDPLACAVAAGWSGTKVESMRVLPVRDAELLRLQSDQNGQPVNVLVAFDEAGFSETWLRAVEKAQLTVE
ncbi:MAG: nucleoside hydrolase [Actinomycetota bacterium]|nr:nucleoside hydrolase [Actinomycetota bacterium]